MCKPLGKCVSRGLKYSSIVEPVLVMGLIKKLQIKLAHTDLMYSIGVHNYNNIPANFFWDMGVRFLSWECWYFWRWHNHFRRFSKKSESSEDSRNPSPSLRTRLNASSLPLIFTSIIRDREEGVVIYSFNTWFSFLTWVWVDIFLEILSSKTATTLIFQSGVRN